MTNRTLTILFSDMVGSTELLGSLDHRHADRLLGRHLDAVRDQIERRGGRQIKNLGDGVMAAFETARDAIEGAVAIQHVTTGAPRRELPRVSVRIGLSSGDVCADDGDCFGTAVVEASRLCDRASGGQVLIAESTHLLARSYEAVTKLGDLQLKGLADPTAVWEALWTPTAPAPLRVVLADDAVLVREGVSRVLEELGIEVLAQVGDAEQLLRATAALHPDLAIVDVRMPPTHTTEGLDAAEYILTNHTRTGVLVLSQDVEPYYAQRLLAASRERVGYLLKERVADIYDLERSVRRVAAGGLAFEPLLEASLDTELVSSTNRRCPR